MGKRPRYTDEFKQEAVNQVLVHGYPVLEVSKRLRELESENNKLKKLLAEKLLENEAMKDVLSKKW